MSSCIVTEKADTKWKKFVLQYLRKNPEERVYLSGCAPLEKGKIKTDFFEIHPELTPFQKRIILLEEDPENEKTIIPTLDIKKIQSFKKSFENTDIYTRKYLVIQMGCDNHCTFCLTIRAR